MALFVELCQVAAGAGGPGHQRHPEPSPRRCPRHHGPRSGKPSTQPLHARYTPFTCRRLDKAAASQSSPLTLNPQPSFLILWCAIRPGGRRSATGEKSRLMPSAKRHLPRATRIHSGPARVQTLTQPLRRRGLGIVIGARRRQRPRLSMGKGIPPRGKRRAKSLAMHATMQWI